MANQYLRLNLAAPGGGTDDKTVKVSTDDVLSGFLEDKIISGSAAILLATLSPGGEEEFEISLDETQIDHNNLNNYDVNEHRPLDDASTTTTSLWSSDKIQTELDGKINAATPMTDNKIVKSVGTSGIDVEATGIDVDDLNNVTGINDLIIDGDLTVNGTTTSVNSETLEVEDANVTVNKNGDQAAADAQNAGITVEMSDAADAIVGYDSTTTSKFIIGPDGNRHEAVTTVHNQALLNKTINADNNLISELETDNLKAGVVETDLNNSVDNATLAGAQAIKDYVAQELATQDDASEITYTPADLSDWDGSVDPGNVDGGLDQLADRTTTAEGTLSSHIGAGAGKHAASQINNTPSGNLAATDLQGAVDELQSDVDTRALASDLSDHISDPTDAHAASAITNTPSGNLTSTDVQAALNELQTDIDTTNAAIPTSIDDLSDVDTSTAAPIDNQVLTWNGTDSEWQPANTQVADELVTTAQILNNQTLPANVTGFVFDKSTYVGGIYSYSAYRATSTNEVIEIGTIHIGHRPVNDTIVITQFSGADDAGVSFDVNSVTGQVTYTSSNLAGSGYDSELRFEIEKQFALPPTSTPPVSLSYTPSLDSTGTFSPTSDLLIKTSASGWDLSVRTDQEATSDPFSIEVTIPVVTGVDIMFGMNDDVGGIATSNNATYGIYMDSSGTYNRTDGTNFALGFDTPAPAPANGDSFRWEIVSGDLILSHKTALGSFSQIHNYGPVSYPVHFEWKPFTSGAALMIDNTSGIS